MDLLIIRGLFSVKIFAQVIVKDSCAGFTLAIEGKNLISDSMIFSYPDCDKSKFNDTIVLSHGKAIVAGKINRAIEAILFTDVKSRWMDGPKVIRFIISLRGCSFF